MKWILYDIEVQQLEWAMMEQIKQLHLVPHIIFRSFVALLGVMGMIQSEKVPTPHNHRTTWQPPAGQDSGNLELAQFKAGLAFPMPRWVMEKTS